MKVLLIDDHRLFREGVTLLLRSLMQDIVISEAGSCEEALLHLAQDADAAEPASEPTTASTGETELILMDLGLPGLSGLDGIALLRASYPDIPVVALSASEDLDTVMRALDAGAMGFIPKSASAAILVQALHLVLAKGIYLPPAVFLSGRGGLPVPPMPHAKQAAEAPEIDALAAFVPARAAQEPHQLLAFQATHEQLMAPRGVQPADLGLSPRQTEVLHLILQGKSNKLICRELALSLSTVKVHTSAVLRALHVTTRTQAVVMAAKLGLRFDNPAELDS